MRFIVLINNDVGLYGFRKELLEKIIADGNQLYVSFPDGIMRKNIENLGCTYINTPIDRRGMNPIKDIGLFRCYRKLLRELQPDVVLLYTVKPNVYGGLACRMARVPYIATITGLGTTFEQPGLLRNLVVFLYRLGLKKASAVMFQNAENQKLFEKLKIGRNYHAVSGSGVNLEQHRYEAYPEEDTTVRLTFVGRIMRDKGINELLDAAEGIKKSHPEIQFDLIGGFDEAYQTKVEEAVAHGIVNYLGVQKEMHPFYTQSWAVVMPSYHEGLCNVCLEGASTGRPLLATNVPGCQETFEDGISGFGFEPKSAKALQDVIEKFLSLSYEEKVKMGQAGRKKMEQEFDRNLVVNAYMNEIKKTAGD